MENGNEKEGKDGSLILDKHWTVQKIFKEDWKEYWKGAIEPLELFMNAMSLQMLHECVLFKPGEGQLGDADDLDKSFLWLVLQYAWIATIKICHTKRETQGEHCLRLYSDTYTRTIAQAIEQLIGDVREFLEYWAEDEVVARPSGKVTKMVSLLSSAGECILINSGLLAEYVSGTLEDELDCNVGCIENKKRG